MEEIYEALNARIKLKLKLPAFLKLQICALEITV